tara:strand:+ start:13 stop:213 length:201 start_codon:yes stop_codon:yes gene_type:complete
MSAKKLKNTDLIKLKEEVLSLKKLLLNLNFQKSTGQLEKTHEIKKSKKNLARLKMNINKITGDNNA